MSAIGRSISGSVTPSTRMIELPPSAVTGRPFVMPADTTPGNAATSESSAVELHALRRVRIADTRQRQIHRHDTLASEAGIDAHQLDEAVEQQAGGNEADGAQRHFGRHQHVERSLPAARPDVALRETDFMASCGSAFANCHAGSRPHARLVNAAITTMNAKTRASSRTSSIRGKSIGAYARTACSTTCANTRPTTVPARERCAFGQRLSQQSRRRRADGAPHGNFPAPLCRSHEQQIRDVDAAN